MHTTRRLVLWLGALLLLCTLSPSAWAWGERGHRIVGHMARLLLTPKARITLQQMMGSDDLATFALYLDQHKDDLERRIPGSRQWHYDDVPVCTAAPEYRDYCPQAQRCASAQIVRHASLLARQQTSSSQKQFAVRVLTHLVGDIHQPLHAADNHDQGGNQIQVRLPEGQTISLHMAWDSALVQRRFGRQSDTSIARRLVTQYASQAAAWQAGTTNLAQVQTWVQEAHQSAQTLVYGQLTGFACGGERASTPVVLQAAYLQAANGVIEAQLARAGYRLAAVLNKALK